MVLLVGVDHVAHKGAFVRQEHGGDVDGVGVPSLRADPRLCFLILGQSRTSLGGQLAFETEFGAHAEEGDDYQNDLIK